MSRMLGEYVVVSDKGHWYIHFVYISSIDFIYFFLLLFSFSYFILWLPFMHPFPPMLLCIHIWLVAAKVYWFSLFHS
jgi:hypothetical protein